MASCPKCGAKISEAAVICPSCKCDINAYKDNIKAEREKAAAERAEKARLAAEKEKLEEELADRLICPDCGEKVTLEDKTCPKCGFPLDDKGERERMKVWRNIQSNTKKPGFKKRWLTPIGCGFVVAEIVTCFLIKLSDNFDDFLHMLPIPIFIWLAIVACSVFFSFRRAEEVDEKNFEQYMIENENMSSELFIEMIKTKMTHCPYCGRRLTEKSKVFYVSAIDDIRAISCEHCGKTINFPGDSLRASIKNSQIKRNHRRNRWGL